MSRTTSSAGLKGVVWVGVCALAAGCGGGGPARYDLSGEVTFDGQPIPAGYIVFTPDADKGNPGPSSAAPIKDGKYQTEEGKGVIGGAHVARIEGYDGVPVEIEGEGTDPNGKSLFAPYRMDVDLPAEGGEFALNVPKEAGDI